jgi:hypothetical protein
MIEELRQEECTAALLQELRWGRQVKQSFEQIRETEAAIEAKASVGHKAIPGLGKLALVVPAYEFFTIREKYGPECFHDKGFIRDFQRLEPSMAANKV